MRKDTKKQFRKISYVCVFMALIAISDSLFTPFIKEKSSQIWTEQSTKAKSWVGQQKENLISRIAVEEKIAHLTKNSQWYITATSNQAGGSVKKGKEIVLVQQQSGRIQTEAGWWIPKENISIKSNHVSSK